MARRLAPSLVVTFSAAVGLACARNTADPIKPDPNGGVVANPPVPTADVADSPNDDPTIAKPEPKATRKRKRTAPARPPKYVARPVSWSDLVEQNPKTSEGRTILVARDDHCYVEKPGPTTTAPLPPGMRNVVTEPVDCPEELDDPAWDHCLASRLSADVKTGECHCVPMDGNPPPPPAEVPCPAKPKTIP